MSSYIKLAIIFSKLAKNHGTKILHGTDVYLLTKDLGKAVKRQKNIILDPDMGVFETTYEALPVIAEVQILTAAVSKKLGVSGNSIEETLTAIVKATEAKGSDAADDIKDALEWTREFMSQPEIKKIMEAKLVEIEKPKSWRDIKGFGMGAIQGTQRIVQEANRLQNFVEKAKEKQRKAEKAEKDTKKKGNGHKPS